MHIQFVENIKQKVGDYVFKRNLKQNNRIREVHNLHTAQSIGILYNATDIDDMMLVSQFVNELYKTNFLETSFFPEFHIILTSNLAC